MTIVETTEAQLLWTHNLSTFYWIFHFSAVIYPVSCAVAEHTLPIGGILLTCVEILVSSNWCFFFHCFCYRFLSTHCLNASTIVPTHHQVWPSMIEFFVVYPASFSHTLWRYEVFPLFPMDAHALAVFHKNCECV